MMAVTQCFNSAGCHMLGARRSHGAADRAQAHPHPRPQPPRRPGRQRCAALGCLLALARSSSAWHGLKLEPASRTPGVFRRRRQGDGGVLARVPGDLVLVAPPDGSRGRRRVPRRHAGLARLRALRPAAGGGGGVVRRPAR